MYSRTLIALTISLLVTATGFATPLFADDRPNIILIMADDMGRETVGVHGGLDYKTPELDKLAAQGLSFDHCYSLPICTPSRVKLMTGKYSFRNYVGFGKLDPGEKTFGNVLQKAGYETCITGKWQLGGDHDQIKAFGWDEYALCNGVGTIDRKAKPLWEGRERYWFNKKVIANGEHYRTEERYGPDMISEYAVNFVKRERGKPFFLYYPMILPHSPWGPTPHSKSGDKSGAKICEVQYFKDNIEYIDHLVGRVVKALEESGQRENTIIMFTGDNGSGYPVPVSASNPHMRRVGSTSGWSNYEEILLKPGDKTPTSMKKGQVVIQEGPLTETTYGDVPGRKNRMLRDGTGVPCVMDWPKYRQAYERMGHRHDDLIDFSDFFATILDVAGTSVDYRTDGVSFSSRLRGEDAHKRDYIFCHYWGAGRDPPNGHPFDGVDLLPFLNGDEGGSRPHDVMYWRRHNDYAIRDGDWKLSWNDTSGSMSIELFDLASDPGEYNDIASQQSERAQRMQDMFDAWDSQMPDSKPWGGPGNRNRTFANGKRIDVVKYNQSPPKRAPSKMRSE